MAAVGLKVDAQIKQKWDEITEKDAKINFYITEFVRKPKHALNFFADGNGGLDELSAVLQQNTNKPLFGILKVVFYDCNGSPYVKFIFFKYVPTKVPAMTKGHLTPNLGVIELQFPMKHLTYILDEQLDKFDMKHISSEFDRVTENIVEIDYFSFGENQTYKWAKKVLKPDLSKVNSNDIKMSYKEKQEMKKQQQQNDDYKEAENDQNDNEAENDQNDNEAENDQNDNENNDAADDQ